jgi:hypothetical protein
MSLETVAMNHAGILRLHPRLTTTMLCGDITAHPCCTTAFLTHVHAHAETILALPLDRWFFNSAMSPVPPELRKPDVAEAGLQQCVHPFGTPCLVHQAVTGV